MTSRRPHFKSRNGCQTCKRRRVKCDEQGPPCANCVIRKTHCVYGPPPGVDVDIDQRDSSSTSSPYGVGGHGSNGNKSASPVPGPRTGTGPASQSPVAGLSRRLLELELMHRYSTSTYKSVGSLSSEAHLVQVLFPREALKHDFLMDGLFAFSAYDMAVSTAPAPASAGYARAALEYFDRGLGRWKALLGDVDRENSLAVFGFGAMSLVLYFLVPQFSPEWGELADIQGPAPGPAKKSALLLFDSLPPICAITRDCWEWLEQSPLQLYAFLEQNVPFELLDADVKAAVARLLAINTQYHGRRHPFSGGTTRPPGREGAEPDPPNPDHESYQSAILHLEAIFARDLDGTVRMTLISWTMLVDPRFVGNFRRSEPVALLVMMHWAVLVHNLGKEAWWASQAGRNLAAELSAELHRSRFAAIPEWQEAISWVRRQVGLPDMLF